MIDPVEVRRFAAEWYRGIDVHIPVAHMAAMVSDEVDFQLPEGPLTGRRAFEKWYETVTAIFFDTVHELRSVELGEQTGTGEEFDIKVVVRWEASFWRSPAAWSQRLNMLAYQRWNLKQDVATGRFLITKYIVDSLVPLPGSASLDPQRPAVDVDGRGTRS